MTTVLLAMLLGLAAAVVAVSALAVLDLTIRRAEFGAALVFLSAIAQAVFIYNVPSVRLGGMRVGVTDIVAVVVLAAAVARCLRLDRFSRYHYWLILLSGLLLVSLLLGVAGNGVQASVSDSRQYLFFVGAALYMATFRPTRALYDRIGRVWLAAAALMMLVACIRWLDVFGGIDLGIPPERNGVDTAVRVLDGPYAFLLAGPLIMTIPFWRRGQPRWIQVLGAALLLVVIVLDRRTVWLAVLVGVAVLVLRGRRLRARSVALVTVAAVLTVLAFAGDVLARDDAPPGAVTSTGSVTWRIEGWSDLVDVWVGSPANWLVGEPFGGGFARTVEGSSIDTHPHNFYIETMIRAGVGGLIALLALTAGLLRRLWSARSAEVGLFGVGLLAPLLAMQLIWYLTWIPGLEQGIVTGIAIAVAAVGRSRSSAAGLSPAIPAAGSRPVQQRAARITCVRHPSTARQPAREVAVDVAPATVVEMRGPVIGPVQATDTSE